MRQPSLFLHVDRLPTLTAEQLALSLDQRAARQMASQRPPVREQPVDEKS